MPDTAFLDRVLAHLDALEPLTSFPGVDEIGRRADEIAAAHPERVSRTRIGTSRLGEDIYEYAVGDGPAVLVIGGVHPNEPIGFHTALRLLDEVARGDGPAAELGVRWRIVPCADPDGTRLNEGWFAAPGDRIAYARAFYRPAPREQVEWSFPFDYKGIVFDDPIPETRAIMGLIDDASPALVVGLHNAELGGVYYYITPDLAATVPALHAIPARLGLPLDRGEPEFAGITPLADAVFPALTSHDMVDAFERMGVDPAGHVSAGGTGDYIRAHGSSAFVAELPYWSHRDSDDTRPTARSYADVLRHQAAELDELGDVLGEAADDAEPHLRIDSQLRRASIAFAHGMRGLGEAARRRAAEAGADRPATTAEVFSNTDVVRMFRLRFGSMLARTLRAEIDAGTAAPAVRRALARLEPHLAAWYREATSLPGLETLPIERLVGVQYGTLLIAAEAAVAIRLAGARA